MFADSLGKELYSFYKRGAKSDGKKKTSKKRHGIPNRKMEDYRG